MTQKASRNDWPHVCYSYGKISIYSFSYWVIYGWREKDRERTEWNYQGKEMREKEGRKERQWSDFRFYIQERLS